MKIPYLDLSKNNKKYEADFLEKVSYIFKNSSYIGGKSVKEFEELFSEAIGAKHAIGTSNGTDAFSVALKALDLRRDGVIYYPENTFIGSILGGLQMEYWFKPYPVNKQTLNADKESLKFIGKDASAVITVNLYGHAINDIEHFQNFCKERTIPLIEDVSQAHFQEHKTLKKKFGTFGDISFFSLYPGKNLGSIGDAGIICTNDDNIAKKAKSITNYGMTGRHVYEYEGFNHRLDSLQAAFLSLKIADRQKVINKRRKLAQIYIENLECVDIKSPEDVNDSVWHVFCAAALKRDELKTFLEQNNIGTNIHYPVKIHEIKCWKKRIEKNNILYSDNSNIISLPCHEGMTKKQVIYITEKIKEFYK